MNNYLYLAIFQLLSGSLIGIVLANQEIKGKKANGISWVDDDCYWGSAFCMGLMWELSLPILGFAYLLFVKDKNDRR